MSDESRGEGWWLASDGKWYPREASPSEAGKSDGGEWFRRHGWRPACDGKWYPPDRTPGPGWWITSNGVWYPPTPVDPASKQRSVFKIALGTAVGGWIILGLIVMLGSWTDVSTTCTANRGDAYRNCVRRDDEGAMSMQAFAMGLAVMGLVIVLAGSIRQRFPVWRDSVALMALATSALLFAASVFGWILGAQGLWAPDRPYPYDPVAASDGHAAMLAGAVVGLLVGAFVLRRRTAPENEDVPSS